MEKEFIKVFNRITAIYSSIITCFTTIFGIEWIFFATYLILNIFDYITGTIKAKIKKVENSNKGLIGIVKKICYWILIAISFLISFVLMQIGTKIDINLEFIMFFGWFTLACLIINETRSIIENLVEIGINVPNFLIKGLEIYSKLLNNKIDTFTETKKTKKKT